MSLQNAKKFIERIQNNPEFRESIDKIKSKQVFDNFLTNQELTFTLFEFAEMVNMLHVKCQFAEDTDRLMNVKNWYELTIMSLDE